MADIVKDDVRTYVWALISKEFKSDKNTGKNFWDNRTVNTDEHLDCEKRPVRDFSFKE